MNVQTKPTAAIRHEAMRIAGKRVETDERDRGAQPLQRTRSSARCRRRGPSMCARPSPRPRPSSRSSPATSASRSCSATAETAARPQGGVRPPHHGRVRPVLEGLALRGGPRLRRLFLRRRSSRSRTTARSTPATSRRTASSARSSPRACRCSASSRRSRRSITRSTWSVAQARAGDRHQQPRGAEADRADAADRAGAGRRALRGRPAAGDAVGRDRQSRRPWATP